MTLENIHRAAKAEFLEKGYKDASLRNIVKSVGMTTGAFYGYYKSKEELFEAIVGEHYEYIRNRCSAVTCYNDYQWNRKSYQSGDHIQRIPEDG